MEPIASTVTELELAGGARIFIAPTKAKDVVTVQGSVLGGWNMLPKGKGDVQILAVDLLDAGTKTKSKDQIRESLTNRGIDLSFTPGGDRTFFRGSCLPEDLSFLLETIVDCLSNATFPAKELALAKERALASWEESRTDTKTQASIASLRELYDANHLNYPLTIDERIKATKAVTREDLLAFRKQFGSTGMVLVIVGDVSEAKTEKIARASVQKLPAGTAAIPAKKTNAKEVTLKESLVPIKDKANIDVFIGAATPITIYHPLYMAYEVFSGMLGGRGLSTGHLMRTIRERDGLTYGIYAQSFGFGDGLDGAFRIWATFSPATFKTAVEKTRKEIAWFLKNGITPKALLMKQDQLTGSYVVGLSTTNGLAHMLHMIGTEGKPLSYLDAYPDLIRAVTIEDLKAVAKLIPFDKLSLAASGSFEKSGK